MRFRILGKTQINVSEIGYGMWGMAGWTGSDDRESEMSLDLAVDMGCNFFDTAYAYGEGKSERLLGNLLRRHPNSKLVAASKIPPKNRKWPSSPMMSIEEVFPVDYIEEYVERTLKNLNTESIDIMQFHVWEDAWANIDEWKRTTERLKQEGKVKHWGLSLNRWQPENGIETIKTGSIDTIQVIYNIFDQAPEDQLFPICLEHNVGVIARVPFDEGTLTGTLTLDTVFPEDDWRKGYFNPENLKASVQRAEALRADLPESLPMAKAALQFILHHPAVSTIIPGMRKEKNVKLNMSVSDEGPLSFELLSKLKNHRWDRRPTKWSQ